MRPEVELLLGCLQPTLTGQQIEKIRQLAQAPLEWNFVVELVNRHAIHPLVYRHFKTHCTGLVPAYLLTWLHDLQEQTAIGNLLWTGQLVALLDAFRAQEIPVIPYKGPVLAQLLYGDPALRLYGDLDLIVPVEQVAAARQILLDADYRQSWPGSSLSASQTAAHLQTKYNYQFRRAEEELAVELHWAVTPSYLRCPPDPAWLWNRLSPGTLAGRAITIFPPEELLLILCLHGGNHCWIKLSWIVDLAQLLRRYPALDWARLLALAQRWRSQRLLGLGLYLAQTLLGSPVPPALQQALQADSAIPRLAQNVLARLFSREYRQFGAFEEPYFHVQLREGWADRLHYSRVMLLPTAKDVEFLALPEALAFLYYPLRPLRLAYEHGLKRWFQSK